MTKRSLSYLMLIALTFTSCSKLEDMSKNATEASENSGRAADAATESREEIANGRIISRAGGAKAARGYAFDRMITRYTLEGKVVEAAAYMKAFEYQLWTGQRYDKDEYLQELVLDAVNEIYRNINELNAGQDLNETGPTVFRISEGKKDRDMNIIAMALAMHKVHGLQITVEPIKLTEDFSLAFNDDSMGISVLDYVKSTLIKIKHYEELKSKNEFIDINTMLSEPERVIYSKLDVYEGLITTRYNALLSLAIVELSNLEDNKINAFAALFAPSFMDSVESEFIQLNDAQKLDANKYLEEAFKLKTFMVSNGYNVEMYDDIYKIFRKMNHPKADDESLIEMNVVDRYYVEEHYRLLNNIFEMKRNRVKALK